MRYFTPDLYVQFNSRDRAKASLADQEWDAAQGRYEKRLKEIRRKLPEKVRLLCDTLCLHDASFLGLMKSPPPRWRRDAAIIHVQKADKLYYLLYVLTDKPAITRPVHSSVYSGLQPRWLYDEVDLLDKGIYSHEILVSTGEVYRIVFQEFDFIETDAELSRNGRKSRRTLQPQT